MELSSLVADVPTAKSATQVYTVLHSKGWCTCVSHTEVWCTFISTVKSGIDLRTKNCFRAILKTIERTYYRTKPQLRNL